MKHRSILIVLALGIFFWALSAALDTVLIPNQRFLDRLVFNIPSNELNLRIATLIVLVLTGAALSANSRSQESRTHELATAKSWLTALLDNLPVGVYRVTSEGRILQANRQFAKTLGYEKPEDLATVNLNEAYVNTRDHETQLERLREGPIFAEFELRRKDGGNVWVREYPKATLKNDKTIDYIDGVCVETHGIDAIMRDLAEHKRLESMKDHFIIAVTHELRTPLVSIKGYVDHIISKEPELPDSTKAVIEIVRRNTDRLLELTNDLLNIQDMENRKLEIKHEKINLREMLTQCIEEIQPLLQEKRQKIILEFATKPIQVVGDALRLSEVVVNLLNNASKFSSLGTTITVDMKEDGDAAIVEVADTGIGIDKKELDRVFEPFAVIEKPGYYKGSGLGLSLAKRMIEAQGGRIWVTSAGKGQGATFAFSMPRTEERWVKIHG